MTNLTVIQSNSKPMAEIGKLKRSLEPASEAAMAALLKALIERGWKLSGDMDPKRAAALYCEVIGPKGVGPIKRVAEKMMRGEYEFCERGFIPIPAGMARLCDEEHAAVRSQITDLKRSDSRRAVIWNKLPDSWNNRQREEHIDKVLSELDMIDGAA